MSASPRDVYTLREIARAVGVPAASVRAFITSEQLRPIAGGCFFAEADVVSLAPAIRALSAGSTLLNETPLFAGTRQQTGGGGGLPLLASLGGHAFLLALSLWLTAGGHAVRAAAETETPRLVYLSMPGPGGGGGGSGNRQLSAPRLERADGMRATAATPPAAVTSPTADPEEPEPLPAHSVIAPVVVTAAHSQEREGVVDRPAAVEPVAQGAGTGGRSGAGAGEGNGEGLGSGLGAGSGGGIGGGAYRPGSGIEAPRLLREVKADYTEAARQQRIEGDVELEIVITRNGSVGQVRVTRGLGEGLDQQAVAAVRQWQFAPARRLGEAIDVVVDVSVEFKLR